MKHASGANIVIKNKQNTLAKVFEEKKIYSIIVLVALNTILRIHEHNKKLDTKHKETLITRCV